MSMAVNELIKLTKIENNVDLNKLINYPRRTQCDSCVGNGAMASKEQ